MDLRSKIFFPPLGPGSTFLPGGAPSPDPMTWAEVPTATSPTSISMAASVAIASDGNPETLIEYLFVCTSDPAFSSDWIATNVYAAQGLDPDSPFGFFCLAREGGRRETAPSTTLFATTPADGDHEAPTPNPPQWDEVPTAISSSEISMAAIAASDPSGGILYHFVPTSGPGAQPSPWQSSRFFTATNLQSFSNYRWKFEQKDSLGNVSEFSEILEAQTLFEPDILPPTPNPAEWLVAPVAISSDAIAMQARAASDPSGGIEYLFRNLSRVGHDSPWQASPLWIDSGLGELSDNLYEILYRDAAHNEGTPSVSLGATTFGPPDLEAPEPDPSTWDLEPTALSSTVVSMSASPITLELTLPVSWEFLQTDAAGVVQPGMVSSGWQGQRDFTIGGQAPGVQTFWKQHSRDSALPPNVGGFSPVRSVTPIVPDTSPPLPNPPEWEIEPFALDDQSISMTARAPTFEPSTPVEWFFRAKSPGGHDSLWQQSRTYIDQGLPADTDQTYDVENRDALGNTGSFSIERTARTQPSAGGGSLPIVDVLAIAPENNKTGAALMLWPNMVSIRSRVDPVGLECDVQIEIDTDPSFSSALSFAMATGSDLEGHIPASRAGFGFSKVGKHLHDLIPDFDYFARIAATNENGTSYSQTLHVHTPALGVGGSIVNLQWDSLRQRSASELWPYWRAEAHNGRRFAWRYRWSTSSNFSTVLGTYEGFYDGPSSSYTDPSGNTTFPRAEMLWSILNLAAGTDYWVELSIWNGGGKTTNVQKLTTEAASIGGNPAWLVGTPDQKVPLDRWGWRPSDPRDNSSPRLGPNTPTVFGCLSFDGDHTHEPTAGHGLEEKDYTIYVDHLGFSRMWKPVGDPLRFTSSTDSEGSGGGGTANIQKAARALKGIGGIVRVAQDPNALGVGRLYQAGDWGGQQGSGAPASGSEGWWDNGLSGGALRYYPLTGVRIQAANYLSMPRICGTVGMQASHGGINGLHFQGFVFFNKTHNSETIFFPGPSTNAGGMVSFLYCDYQVDKSFTTGFPGYGVLWHIKATSTYAVEIRHCSFSPAKEHSGYLNSLGMLGNVDSFFEDNWVKTSTGPNLDGWARANGRTMFQTDSRGDVISAGNQLGTQTGLAPGRGTLWFIGNSPVNGSGLGGGSGGKGLSVPGHRGKIFIDEHAHGPDPDGNDYGLLNSVGDDGSSDAGGDSGKGCWGNANGFANDEVEIGRIGWTVTNTISNMLILNSVERFKITKRPTSAFFDSTFGRWRLSPATPVVPVTQNNRVAIMLSETTSGPPWPHSVGTIEFSFEGTEPDALLNSPCWPSNLSMDKRVKYQAGGNINGTIPFDDTPVGRENMNHSQAGMTLEAIV